MTIIDVWVLRYRARRTDFLVILDHFLPFYPFFENLKKSTGDIIILHKCTKNHDHMLYCSWDTVHDRCSCYFSFWAIFSPFTSLTCPKNGNFKKMRKTPGDIIISSWVPKIMIRWCPVPEIWCATDGQTDGRTDGKSDM